MTERRILLDSAAFLDDPRSRSIEGVKAADVRAIVQRFLECCYLDIGKTPRLVDGEEMGAVLKEILPARFTKKDPLAAHVEAVLDAYLHFLGETQVVLAAFEQRRALAEHADAFRSAVAAGAAGPVAASPERTLVHRAERTGRNDPCPCGSGKKFKKCCMLLG